MYVCLEAQVFQKELDGEQVGVRLNEVSSSGPEATCYGEGSLSLSACRSICCPYWAWFVFSSPRSTYRGVPHISRIGDLRDRDCYVERPEELQGQARSTPGEIGVKRPEACYAGSPQKVAERQSHTNYTIMSQWPLAFVGLVEKTARSASGWGVHDVPVLLGSESHGTHVEGVPTAVLPKVWDGRSNAERKEGEEDAQAPAAAAAMPPHNAVFAASLVRLRPLPSYDLHPWLSGCRGAV